MRKTSVLVTLGLTLSILTPTLASPNRQRTDVLPNGANAYPKPKVDLVMITAEGLPATYAWHRDGSRATQDELRTFNSYGMSFEPPSFRRNIRIFYVDVEGVSNGHTRLYTPGCTEGTARNGKVQGFTACVPYELSVETQTDLRVGLAYEPFQSVGPVALGEAPFNIVAKDGRHRLRNGKSYKTNCCTVHLTVPDSLKGLDLRLVVYNAAGAHSSVMDDPYNTLDGSQETRSYAYYNVPAQSIKRVELSARPIQWTTFKNVQLQPSVHK